jgi:hypothetical protein
MPTPGLIECDFCTSRTAEAWSYSHRAFRFGAKIGNEANLIDAKEGQVAVCARCREFVESRDTAALLARFRAIAKPHPAALVLIATLHSYLLDNLTGEVEHRLASEHTPNALLIEDACPRCGRAAMYDRRSAKANRIESKCEGCGLPIILLNVAPPSGWND